jgi:hypothetical protein
MIELEILTRALPTFLKKITYFCLFLIVCDEGLTSFNSAKCKHVKKTIFYLNLKLNYDFLFILLPQIGFYTKSGFGI